MLLVNSAIPETVVRWKNYIFGQQCSK